MFYVTKLLMAGLMIAATTLTSLTPSVRAQSAPEPAIIISIASIAEQNQDVDYLVEAAGFGQMKFMAQTVIKQYTKGVNSDTPAGVLLFFDEDKPTPDFLAFIPVSNLDDLLDTIAGIAEVDEEDDLVTVVLDNEQEFFIKKAGEFAYFSTEEKMFENLPDNPVELLGKLPKQYNLAAQVFGQRIPEALRKQAIDAIRGGYEDQMEMLPDDSATAELQKKNFETQIEQLRIWLNQTDSLKIGLNADKDGERLYMDVEGTALPGSKLAERFAAMKTDQKTMFGGFMMEGAAMTLHGCTGLHPDDIKQLSESMDQLDKAAVETMETESDLSDEEIKVLHRALQDFIAIAKETLNEGFVDMGAVLMLKEGNPNLAAGFRVSNPQKLEASLKELLAFAEQKLGGELQVEMNSGSYRDVTFHRIVVNVPDDQEEVRDAIGDQVVVIIGIGEEAVYFGAGAHPVELIKQAMDGTGTPPTSVTSYNFYLAPMLRFASGVDGNPVTEAMATELEKNGKDRIRVQSDLIENGFKVRAEMQDGILALIQTAIQVQGKAMPGNGADF